MMRRFLLLLPVAAALGVVVIDRRAAGQPGDDFGILRTTPAPASPAAPRALPAGVVPDGAASSQFVNPFPLTADVGTWVICAAHFVGPDGGELARQTAQQLRERHRMNAYIFNRGDEERRKQQQEWEELKKRYPNVPIRRRGPRIQDQYAVLIGGFKDFADASAFLPRIRALPLPELKLAGGRSPYEHLFYTDSAGEKKQVVKKAVVNPYHNAMVVRNPLVANAQAAKPKWDPFWKTLNADEEYSLLKNPKPYTLVVKEYFGARTMQPKGSTSGGFLAMLGLGGAKEGATLDAAAAQARELARFLSHKPFNFKAYVLHTRYSSVVTVGGFNGPDDPELHRVQGQLAKFRFSADRGGADPIGLLPNPIPVEVPRP